MENYAHLVEINEETQTLTIYRVDPKTGRRTLYTHMEIPSMRIEAGEAQFRDFSRLLGENLLIDSPAARRLLGL